MARTAADRIAELEGRLDELTRELCQVKEDRDEIAAHLKNLRDSDAEKGVALGEAGAEQRRLESEISRLEAAVKARDTKVGELREEITKLRTRVAELADKDPEAVAAAEIAAARLLEESSRLRADEARQREADRVAAEKEAAEAEARSLGRKIRLWGTIVGVALSAIVFTVIGLVKAEVPPLHLIVGVTALAASVAWIAPVVVNLFNKVGGIGKYWRWGFHGLALALGVTISSLGIPEGSPALVFGIWLATAVGFAVVFSLFVEAVGTLVRAVIAKGDNKNTSWKDLTGETLLFAIPVSLILAVFWRPLSSFIGGWGTADYLIHVLLYIMGSSIGGLALVLIWWVVTALLAAWEVVMAWVQGVVKSMRKISKRKTPWLQRVAQGALVFFSAFIGILVGSGFSSTHGDNETNLGALLAGIGAGTGAFVVFCLIEGLFLREVFDRRSRTLRKFVAVICAVGFATITAYITFGWIYYAGSASDRFSATKTALIRSMDGALQATESTCTVFAQSEADSVNNVYTASIRGMQTARQKASGAKNRAELEDGLSEFRAASSKAAACLSMDDREAEAKNVGPLSKVLLPEEPSPGAMSAQYLLGKEIPGYTVNHGAATGALVVVLIIDYLLPLFMLVWVLLSLFGRSGE